MRDRNERTRAERRDCAALQHRAVERHDVAAIDAHEVMARVEPLLRGRPEIPRRFAEVAAIRRERVLVPVVKLALLGSAAFGRSVMQRPLERVAAQRFPVVPRVGQVQMPDLIDLVRRRHGMARVRAQKAELAVLLDRLPGELDPPAVLAGESRGERESDVRSVEIEARKAVPGRELLYVHVLPHYCYMPLVTGNIIQVL